MLALKHFAVSLALCLSVLPTQAAASFVPPEPFDPREFKSGVILQGTILASEIEEWEVTVAMAVERVVQGDYSLKQYRFSFSRSFGDGPCPTASTQDVPAGQKLVVHLERRNSSLREKGWMHFEEERKQDGRVLAPSSRYD